MIEISNLDQLAAIRSDLDGDGVSSVPTAYAAAFPNAMPGMGCPDPRCTGYELIANLDFDTNGNGAPDAGDAYWNDGAGWIPIGDRNHKFTADFDGNNHTISNLYINNQTAYNFDFPLGLFGYVSSSSIKRVGLVSATVSGFDRIGGLVGEISGGAITACYVTGSVSGSGWLGGLVGVIVDSASVSGSYATSSVSGGNDAGGLVGGNYRGTIIASYATGSVSGNVHVGGLVGGSDGGTIIASYATGSVSGSNYVGGLMGMDSWYNGTTIAASYAVGRVSASNDTANIGGLVGFEGRGFIIASYWDTETSGQAGSHGGVGKSTAELQSPTGYAGIYARWNLDLDGDGNSDNPWHFGNSRQYPALQYDGLDVAQLLTQPTRTGTTDYDTDQDGLIEISNLDQLAAIRSDLDGDGASSVPTAYSIAFPNAMPGMGCPDTGCIGYELTANLDFDTNGNGTPDAGDTYWNNGAGWIPIGHGANTRFTADFDGNNHTIANLYINRSGASYTGLFGNVLGSSIRQVGLVSATVSGGIGVGGLVGVSSNGAISGSYATGNVSGGCYVGALVGLNYGSISGSYATGRVSSSGFIGSVGGLVGSSGGEGSITSCRYYTSGSACIRASGSGSISGSYATGNVSGDSRVGGLVGESAGAITASYAAGNVSGSGDGIGGLVGWDSGTTITASYAVGRVSASGNTSNIGGLVGSGGLGFITASYWNTETTGQAGSYGGIGKTTAELQSPTGYTGIYAGWNLDLDSDRAVDNPWHFGNSRQYPALQYASLDPAAQRP